jgi:hypothetical protein
MNSDFREDSDAPFEPATPEAFFQRGEEAFQGWWDELEPPGMSGGCELDYETAQSVWSATYEHSAPCIRLIYDSATANTEGAHPTGEMKLACVVDRHHGGSIAFSSPDFLHWVAEHEDHIRYEYFDGYDWVLKEDTITLWIDEAGQSPAPAPPARPLRGTSRKDLVAMADREFARWCQERDPTDTFSLENLDRMEAQIVWREAFIRLWDELEAVHDNAKAYSEIVAERAKWELGYIIDRFHQGRLSLAVSDVMKYWDENEYVLERQQTDECIRLRVIHRRSGCDS